MKIPSVSMPSMETLIASMPALYLARALETLCVILVLLTFRQRLGKFLGAHLRIRREAEVELNINAEEIRRNSLILSGVLFPVCALSGFNVWFALALSMFSALILPRILLKRAKDEFDQRFDEALPESLAGMASSLRAGLTIQKALEVSIVSTAKVFSQQAELCLKQYALGTPIDEALDGVRRRVTTPATNMSFGAIAIGRQLGGPLPDILGRIAHTVRERIRVEGRLRSLTSQGKAQGYILCGAPFVIVIGMKVFDPGKFALLTDTAPGQAILAVAAILWIAGVLITRKVMQLDV